MGRELVVDLMDQYLRACSMLREEIERFGPDNWHKGLDDFLKPVCICMHIVDTLDYYHCGKPPSEYAWGHRFGGGWWELPADQLPSADQILAYLEEIESRIQAELAEADDGHLAEPFTLDGSADTYLGHYIYALRHTMHHHGELAALAVSHGLPGGSWA